jgi:hypothetical protein
MAKSKFIQLTEFVEKEMKDLRKAREICMTTTEKYLLDGRIINVQRIYAQAMKIDGSNKLKLKGKK